MISVLTPTRQRVSRLRETFLSALQMADGPFEFVIYCDNDDLETKAWADGHEPRLLMQPFASKQPRLQVADGPRGLLTDTWNKALEVANGDIIMLGSDDIIFRTPNWVTQIEEQFKKVPNQIGVVHCNNLQSSASWFATHPVVHRRWIDILGYFTPPCFAGDYADTWVWEIAKELNRLFYLPGVIIEHMHFSMGKSEADAVYTDRQQLEGGASAARELYDILWPLRASACRRLRKCL